MKKKHCICTQVQVEKKTCISLILEVGCQFDSHKFPPLKQCGLKLKLEGLMFVVLLSNRQN